MAQTRKKSLMGRPPGSRNKSTIERERRELEALQKRAAEAVLSPLAKDELAALIPQAKELIGVVKTIVRDQQASILALSPTAENAVALKEAWNTLREWMALYADVLLKASQVEYRAADFQSPKFRAIVVAPPPVEKQGEKLTRFGLRVFEGGRALAPPGANGPAPAAEVLPKPAQEPTPATGTDDQEV